MEGYVLNSCHSNIWFVLTFLLWVLLRDNYVVFLAFWTLSAGFTVAKCAYLAMDISNFKTVIRHPIVYQSSNNNILHMHTRGNHIHMKTKMNRNPKSEKWNLVWNKNIICIHIVIRFIDISWYIYAMLSVSIVLWLWRSMQLEENKTEKTNKKKRQQSFLHVIIWSPGTFHKSCIPECCTGRIWTWPIRAKINICRAIPTGLVNLHSIHVRVTLLAFKSIT